MAMDISNTPPFKALDADPGGTLQRFDDYIEEMKLLFTLTFRKADGTAYAPSEDEKKAMTLLKGGKDMRVLFNHVPNVLATDSFDQAITKVQNKLKERTNTVVQRNMLLSNHPQGKKSFEKWSQEVSEAAKLIDYANYDWKQAAVDSMILQTSSSKLREKALSENTSYEDLVKLGITKEQSEKGAVLLEQASGQTSTRNVEEEVRRLRLENSQLRNNIEHTNDTPCQRCLSPSCPQGRECPAFGQRCTNCRKMNHFTKACKNPVQHKPRKSHRRKQKNVARVQNDDSDSETSGRLQPQQQEELYCYDWSNRAA